MLLKNVLGSRVASVESNLQDDLRERQGQNRQEGGARPGEGRPQQLRQRLLHPAVAAVTWGEEEPPPDVSRELDHQTNLRHGVEKDTGSQRSAK